MKQPESMHIYARILLLLNVITWQILDFSSICGLTNREEVEAIPPLLIEDRGILADYLMKPFCVHQYFASGEQSFPKHKS